MQCSLKVLNETKSNLSCRMVVADSSLGSSLSIEDATILANILLNFPFLPKNYDFQEALCQYVCIRVS